jgi:hypothetical protein
VNPNAKYIITPTCDEPGCEELAVHEDRSFFRRCAEHKTQRDDTKREGGPSHG